MIKYKKIIDERVTSKIWYNYYSQMWFKYHSCFFGALIMHGKKLKAYNHLLKIRQKLKIKENADPYFVFLVALMRITPNLLTVRMRLGGMTQEVPVPISEERRISFGVKWIIKLLKDKQQRLSVDTIVNLLLSTIYGKSPALTKKLQLHAKGVKNRHLIRFLKFRK